MITDVEIEDYQALRKVRLKLGRFTVVTGPTGSGKSGLIRAMRLVAFNARGTSYIRHGAKRCKAAIGIWDENVVVGIERGGRGADKYRVVTLTQNVDGPEPYSVKEFTKLAGTVPDEVSKILRLSEINFAGQFDRPYLLTESGSQVARVLGELTNVTLVFDAAREANRRKLDTQREVRDARTRLEGLKEQARSFRGLKERIAAVSEARERLVKVDLITARWDLLQKLAGQHRQAEQDWRDAQAFLKRKTVPSGDRLTELQKDMSRLGELDDQWFNSRQDAETKADEAENWQHEEERLHTELHKALVAAGTCPTCGQRVSGV